MSARIMLIDDSPTACFAVRRVLEQEWMVVETYQRPLPALQALWKRPQTPPTALLVDIALPQLDGYHIAHLIRTKAPDEALRTMPIIGLSARDGVLDRVKGLLVQMNAYLAKPFDPQELLRCLQALPAFPS